MFISHDTTPLVARLTSRMEVEPPAPPVGKPSTSCCAQQPRQPLFSSRNPTLPQPAHCPTVPHPALHYHSLCAKGHNDSKTQAMPLILRIAMTQNSHDVCN